MKKIFFTCIFIGVLMLLISCNSSKYQSEDPFYSSTGERDSIRFPLIKPYETVKMAGVDWWFIDLPFMPDDTLLYGSAEQIQKIAVVNNVIMIYTPYDPGFNAEMRDKVVYWFVLIPAKNIQTGFNNEDEFLKYIQEYGVNEVAWESPEILYQRFLDTGCLEWIPGCQ